MKSPRTLDGNMLPVVSLPGEGRYYEGNQAATALTPPEGTRMVRISVVAGTAWVSLSTLPSPLPPTGDITDDTFDVEVIAEGARLEFQFQQGIGETKTFNFQSTGVASVAIGYYRDLSVIT